VSTLHGMNVPAAACEDNWGDGAASQWVSQLAAAVQDANAAAPAPNDESISPSDAFDAAYNALDAALAHAVDNAYAQSVDAYASDIYVWSLPPWFFSISPVDMHNPTAIRLCFSSASNTAFPAVVDDSFFDALRAGTTHNGVGLPLCAPTASSSRCRATRARSCTSCEVCTVMSGH
jgi:hypothetical protein